MRLVRRLPPLIWYFLSGICQAADNLQKPVTYIQGVGTEAVGNDGGEVSHPQDLTKQTRHGLWSLIKYQINDRRLDQGSSISAVLTFCARQFYWVGGCPGTSWDI